MDGARPEFRTPAASAAGVAVSAARLVYPTISHRATLVEALVAHTEHHRDEPVRAVRRAIRDAVVLKKSSALFDPKGKQEGTVIREFSHQSRYRLYLLIRNCGVKFRSMLTVTYPGDSDPPCLRPGGYNFPREGTEPKKHLDLLNKWLRRNFHGVQGVWFLEFQKRGAPHFHIILDIDLSSYGPLIERKRRKKTPGAATYRTCAEMESAVAKAWYRIVGSRDPKHLRAGTSWEVFESEEAAERYAAKHSAKPRQKEVPPEYNDVGHFWGVIGGVKVQWLDDDFEPMTTQEVFEHYDPRDVMSSKGKVRKYIWGKNES